MGDIIKQLLQHNKCAKGKSVSLQADQQKKQLQNRDETHKRGPRKNMNFHCMSSNPRRRTGIETSFHLSLEEAFWHSGGVLVGRLMATRKNGEPSLRIVAVTMRTVWAIKFAAKWLQQISGGRCCCSALIVVQMICGWSGEVVRGIGISR